MDHWLSTFAAGILVYLIFKAYQQSRYFAKWGIPHPPEVPFFGSLYTMFHPTRRMHVNEFVKYVYNVDEEAKYVGCHIFTGPAIFIKDLELVKLMLVKNFDHFADRKTFVDERTDPLFGKNLNFLNGDRWKEVRNMLSPAFTSSKMRAMFVLMEQCADNFTSTLVEKYSDNEAIDFKEVIGRYTNDVIASCAFGIEVDSLKNPDNEFYNQAKNAATFQGVTNLKLMLEMIFPRLTRLFGLRIISKKLTDFFVNIVSTTMQLRDERGIVRPDMLQLMMEARNKLDNADRVAKYDLLEMTAQAFLFFLAGFDASATQTSLIALELIASPETQAKVQAEVDKVMKSSNGKPTYEVIINEMPYLDAVFSETLRRHPIAFLNRICTKEFELPAALPGGKPYTMKPGMGVMIPVPGIHSDPRYYDEPDKFDPERFIGKKVTLADISNLGFGLGPRMCIGNRFAILEIKALLVHLLAKCTLEKTDKTCVPIVYDTNAFMPTARGGFWLRLKRRCRPDDQ